MSNCPYIVTSDEGTSYCRLAEQSSAELATLKRQLEAVRIHAYITDAGRICDADNRISYKEQLKRSEEYVNRLIATAATQDAEGESA